MRAGLPIKQEAEEWLRQCLRGDNPQPAAPELRRLCCFPTPMRSIRSKACSRCSSPQRRRLALQRQQTTQTPCPTPGELAASIAGRRSGCRQLRSSNWLPQSEPEALFTM
ncbi:hypothetical protein EYF80_042913 [Liparis tanakae]|uniref:Uncharacterized protein n=1 Tax=Liparis tanakae TaxID=230148 RepID=A0A4Z2G067_9TELE|nr:hypothetical protein EYF80_042913 [Liparis tanakae]